MKRTYFIYLHEREDYELYHFQDALRSLSNHFVIDFEEEASLLAFLVNITDGLYPKRIIVDLYDWQRVRKFISKLVEQEQIPMLPVVVLRDRHEVSLPYFHVERFRRPKNKPDWEVFVKKLIE